MATQLSPRTLVPLAPPLPVSSDGGRPDWRHRLRRLAREPFLQFLALGTAIFLVSEYIEDQTSRYRITIDAPVLQRLENGYTQQFGGAPTDTQLRQLVDRHVRSEIFLREGLALGLDQDDEIIRRRIAQKYEFLQQDLGVAGEPDAASLAAWYRAHPERYALPVRRGFSHVYFSVDRAGDAAAAASARAALAVLANSDRDRAPELGDVFPGTADSAAASAADVQRVFGGSDFAARVFAAPVGQWAGPFRSGFGWHLVRVGSELPRNVRAFADVADRVRADVKEGARLRQNAAAYRRLLEQYRVRFDGLDG